MLSGVLPAPKHAYAASAPSSSSSSSSASSSSTSSSSSSFSSSSSSSVPAYPHRASSGFRPRDQADFGDGGAYPEVHMVQYPLNMGKPGVKSTAVVSVDVNAQGQVTYDAIVKQGGNRDKIVKTSLADTKEANMATLDRRALALPEQSEEAETAEKTRLALQALMEGKLRKGIAAGSGAVTIKKSAQELEPTYIRYTPNPDAPGYNVAAKERVIRMVEAQVDPMEPPKHKNTKTPKGPGSPPAPILHSPPRKLTVEDQQAWKIPPCISNWKNAQGYIIPLDKRLAADGRGLQEVTINNKFAALSEALYVSERKAAEDLRVRNQIRKKMAMRDKEDKEADLRDLAMRARLGRAGLPMESGGGGGGGGGGDREELEDDYRGGGGVDARPPPSSSSSHGWGHEDTGDGEDEDEGGDVAGESAADRAARQEREQLRQQRRKERERELRHENLKGARKHAADRNEGRDVSEKIALGMHTGAGSKLTGDGLFDSRLFNQSAGMDAGFGGDDEYNTYSKPLFDRDAASTIYRPKKDDSEAYGDADAQMAQLKDTSRFKADKGFAGAEVSRNSGEQRTAPVQFEKARARGDVFGLDEITGGDGSKRPRHE